jgi:hypothetical protein
MNGQQLKASLVFVLSSFGSFLVSRWATKSYGQKLHIDYGETILATTIAGTAISSAKKIPNQQVGLGFISGTGMNAAWSLASIPKIKEKLPQSIQTTLGSDEIETVQGNSLDGYSDYELMGNERVISIAKEMAEQEKESYLKALISAAKQKQILLPDQIQKQEMGSEVLQKTFQTGLEGDEDLNGDSMDGNSLDS